MAIFPICIAMGLAWRLPMVMGGIGVIGAIGVIGGMAAAGLGIGPLRGRG
jgi:hypothetical protein